MLFSQARKLDVVNTATATRVARVEGFIVLPGPPRVALLRLGKVSGAGTLLAWTDLKGFGPDLEILGKRVLTERGMELGAVADVDFDPETGAVTSMITKTEAIAGRRLIGVGGYAVIVSA